MTKQEEIRDGIAKWLFTFVREREDMELGWGQTRGYYLQEADLLMGYLRSQDVVIKVDRELPNDIWASPMNSIEHNAQQAMLKAGYVVVEPLMKEV